MAGWGSLFSGVLGSCNTTRRVQRKDAFGGNQQRIDVQFRNPRLLHHELAEAHEQLFERGDVRGFAAAHALERGVDLGALHHAARERAVQRRQAQGAVLEDFHQLAARAEQQHRSELRVNAAANDDLVAVELDHGLHRHAQEMFLTGFLGEEVSMAFHACRTAEAVRKFNCTPPTSVLCVMVSE